MTAVAGLLLALICIAIVAAGLALAVTSWQPSSPPTASFLTGLFTGLGCLGLAVLLTALHWIAQALT